MFTNRIASITSTQANSPASVLGSGAFVFFPAAVPVCDWVHEFYREVYRQAQKANRAPRPCLINLEFWN